MDKVMQIIDSIHSVWYAGVRVPIIDYSNRYATQCRTSMDQTNRTLVTTL